MRRFLKPSTLEPWNFVPPTFPRRPLLTLTFKDHCKGAESAQMWGGKRAPAARTTSVLITKPNYLIKYQNKSGKKREIDHENDADSTKTSRKKNVFLSFTDTNLDKRLFTSCKEEDAALPPNGSWSQTFGPDYSLKYLSILPQETNQMKYLKVVGFIQLFRLQVIRKVFLMKSLQGNTISEHLSNLFCRPADPESSFINNRGSLFKRWCYCSFNWLLYRPKLENSTTNSYFILFASQLKRGLSQMSDADNINEVIKTKVMNSNWTWSV